jgi:hypothetical protein
MLYTKYYQILAMNERSVIMDSIPRPCPPRWIFLLKEIHVKKVSLYTKRNLEARKNILPNPDKRGYLS